MKTAAQKYSESNAEAILAYFRGVDGTFVPTPAHPSPRYPMADDTVGIHTVRLSQSTLAGYLEQAFVAGVRAEFDRLDKKARQDAIARIAAKSGKCGACGGDHKDYMVHGATLPTHKLPDVVSELIRLDESRTDEKLRQTIAAADAEADRDDGREPGDTRDEESLEDHNIQGLGAYRDVFDAGGEQ